MRLTVGEYAVLPFKMVFMHAVACQISVVLTQTHPAAPYVCRTGNITLRCQYDGVEGVLNVVWNVDDMVNLDFDSMTLPGHTALDRTDSHQDLVIASFANLRGTYQCSVIHSHSQCQYGGVENVVTMLWLIGFQTTSNASTILGHTALPLATTYQEVVVRGQLHQHAGEVHINVLQL